MKILIVTPYLPHPLSGHGASVYLYGLLERLVLSHKLTVVSFCDERESDLSADLKKLPLTCYFLPRRKGVQKNIGGNICLAAVRTFQLLLSFLLWEPYYVSKFRQLRMSRLIKRLTRHNAYDIVRFEFAYMGQYIGSVQSGRTVLHEIDVTYRPAYRRYRNAGTFIGKAAAFVDWCRWVGYEPSIARRFDRVLCLTEQDKKLLEWLTQGKNISYVPLAFDAPDDVPGYGTREPRSLVFIGSYSHKPNVEAARWLCSGIFPEVVRKFPGSKLYIIGAHAPNEFKAFARQYPGISILGFVGDVDAYLRKCAVFVSPLRFGGGVKTKILSAMAQGIPVVTTKVGVEGIDGLQPDTILIGESTEKIAGHVGTLFEQPERAAQIGRKGWELVRRNYSWQTIIARLESISAMDVFGTSA